VCESLEIGSEPNLRLTECEGLRAVGALAAAVLSVAIISGGPVRGQESASNAGSAINLGSRGLSPSSEGRPEQAENKLEYEVRAGFVTDYIRPPRAARWRRQSGDKPGGSDVELVQCGFCCKVLVCTELALRKEVYRKRFIRRELSQD
jgi:hypothetical protein